MNEDKLRNYTNTQYDSIITIYSHDIKPNWLRFDTQSLRDHPTSAKLQVAKTRVGVSGVGPVSTKAPTGRGQIWTRARICPPALEVETYVPGAEVILSQNNSGHELLPSNNIGRILIAYFFFFWPFLPENSLTLWQKCFTFLPDCELFEPDKWPAPASSPRTWTLMTAVFDLLPVTQYFVCFPNLTNLVWYHENKL